MASTYSRENVQGIILGGYGQCHSACFLLFRVEDRRRALPWLRQLPLTNAVQGHWRENHPAPYVNVAFTSMGIRALSEDSGLADSFPREFVEGPNTPERARILGDVAESASDCWEWGVGDREPHVMLLLYETTEPMLSRVQERYLKEAAEAGLREITTLCTHLLPEQMNHLAFRDGIAQPIVAGSRSDAAGPNVIPPGEILLGRTNAFGTPTYAPPGRSGDFGVDGSYLVFRTFEQDVLGFWRFCQAQSGARGLAPDPIAVATKLVGRWPSGAPLTKHPDRDPGYDFRKEDRFGYAAEDADGLRCPFGAHVRRINPRDWHLAPTIKESIEVANRHRLLRRGRPYGPPIVDPLTPDGILRLLDAPEPPRQERGLHFLCFQASIERQFEFIQQQWANNPNFAGLHRSPDPIVGSHQTTAAEGDGSVFTVPAEPVRRRAHGLQRYHRVRGSAYFFMPSIKAVRNFA